MRGTRHCERAAIVTASDSEAACVSNRITYDRLQQPGPC
jgi:hypothetical protein